MSFKDASKPVKKKQKKSKKNKTQGKQRQKRILKKKSKRKKKKKLKKKKKIVALTNRAIMSQKANLSRNLMIVILMKVKVKLIKRHKSNLPMEEKKIPPMMNLLMISKLMTNQAVNQLKNLLKNHLKILLKKQVMKVKVDKLNESNSVNENFIK